MSFSQRPATAHRPPATNQVSGNSSPRFCVTVHEAERTGTNQQILKRTLRAYNVATRHDERFYFAYGLPDFPLRPFICVGDRFQKAQEKIVEPGCSRRIPGLLQVVEGSVITAGVPFFVD